MLAEERIIRLLEEVGEKGILQSEIPSILDLSKSTVSEILSNLESKRKIVREQVSSRSYRVWSVKMYPNPVEGILRVGVLKSTEYAYLIKSALDCGMIVRVFDDAIELTKALSQGRVDLAGSPLLTQVLMGILMKNIRIVSAIAQNGSGIAIKALRNAIFGASEMSTMDRNLRRYMDKKDISGRVIYFKSPEKMIESFEKCQIDGIAIWEPYLTILAKKGYDVEYFNECLGDFLCCTLAVNTDSYRLNKDLFNEFIDHYWKFDGSLDMDVVSGILGFEDMDKEILIESLKNYRFNPELDMDMVISYLKDAGIEIRKESLEEIIRVV
ncbi:putative transcriptional regulator [Archaeoglobus sulfaticallidus PM70-1]|uniref:Putative transcriptional regulator n=1 Tax=Archaeoglobus sulfaticallidus PM70-1 TaxID=387631 RepID=N0BJB4_9EURY|nr:transcriptional regulator [Archaeoglobus sulfaticallidus]AGK60255.1 putative transcriptional regulator [Archaeoglobus sulfaticallidus PM70-1]